MADVGIRELLEAGVHFGHQTRRWNPKMRRFIHGERDGIYIIDLLKTERLLRDAQEFAADVSRRGQDVLFVGTKKQARDAVKETAEACGMPYVNHRWLGGLLTNFQTVSQRIKRLIDLERYEAEGQLELLPTRERIAAQKDLEKLRANLGGVKAMERVPAAVFVVDLKTEVIAVREAQRLRIPIIGLVDTNVDPDGIDYVIPGNDDAIRSCALITQAIGDVVREGRQAWTQQEEERLRREAEEQARREAEEQARREAEEQARQAEEAAKEERRRETLVQAEGGGDRQVAEAEVAEAVEAGGRPQPDPVVTQQANTDVATPDPVGEEPSPEPAPAAEGDGPITNDAIQADATDQAGREEQPTPAPNPPADPQSPKTNEGTT
jgi:small subunit ribosomal protein S2